MLYEGYYAGRGACLYLLLFLLVAPFPSPAVAGDNIEYGLEAGIAWTDFVGEIVTGQERMTNYSIGGVVFHPLTEGVALGTGVSYARRGSEEPGAVLVYFPAERVVPVKFTHSMHFLEVPILARLILPLGFETLRPTVFVGSTLGINLKSRTRFKPLSDYGGIILDLSDVNDECDLQGGRNADISLVFGGGLRFSSGRRAITLTFRYTYGLTEVLETENPYSDGFTLSSLYFHGTRIYPAYESGGARKHRALTASIGYLF